MEQLRGQRQYQNKADSENYTIGVRAVERAVDILVCLGRSELNLTEISREVNLSKSTVYRILVSLARKGFVAKCSGTGRYLVGWGILELLSGTLSQSQSLVQSASFYMEKLWRHTRETITLCIHKGFSRLCIAEIPSPHPLKYTVGIGISLPLQAGAPGKLLLANLSTSELKKILGHINFRSLTNRTITDKNQLLQELKLIRKQGWATSFGELIEGVSCLAVPVVDRQEKVVASLNILGPSTRLPEKQLMTHLDVLKDAADGIASRRGVFDF